MTRFRVPFDPKALAEVRERVEAQCSASGLEEEDVYLLVSAVDETCGNIVRYSDRSLEGTRYAVKNPKLMQIWLTLSVDAEKFEIEVRDQGFQFDPTKKIPAAVSAEEAARKRGGLGLSIIQKAMHGLRYEFTEDGENSFRMIRYWKEPAKGG